MNVPIKQLEDFGFKEESPFVYCKQVAPNTKFCRDYSNIYPKSKAFLFDKEIKAQQFREHRIIKKIEESMMDVGSLNQFIN